MFYIALSAGLALNSETHMGVFWRRYGSFCFCAGLTGKNKGEELNGKTIL